MPMVQQTVVAAHQGGGDDVRSIEEVGIDLHLKCGGTVAQLAHVVAHTLTLLKAALAGFAGEGAQLLADAPELGVGGMCLEATLVGEGEHLVIHAGGVAYAQHVHPTIYELL